MNEKLSARRVWEGGLTEGGLFPKGLFVKGKNEGSHIVQTHGA